MTTTRQTGRDPQIEREVAALLDKGETDAAWIRTGYMGSAVLKRKWYARIKAALPVVEEKHDNDN